MRIDSSGNVGIGTSSPGKSLEIVGNSMRLKAATASDYAKIGFQNASGKTPAWIGIDGDQTESLSFHVASNIGEGLNFERMRIDGSGNVLVGTTNTNPGESNTTVGVAARNDGIGYFSSDILAGLFNRNNTGTLISMRRAGAQVGDITVTSSTTSYNTSSDERLKENISDAQPASYLIDGIQVREFDWKADGEHQRYGMIAQELEAVAPEAVTKGETEDDMWSVDYSKLVPMLVKEIQDLRKRVADLET